MALKPLNRKAYGSIGHLPMSRMGPGDHAVPEGQADICTKRTRDRRDRVIVQEKLDGSCVAVAKIDGMIVPLGRAGYEANTSPYEQHRMFYEWAVSAPVEHRFANLLRDGQRIVGEWIAQVHSTRYDLRHEPFVAFDIMQGDYRLPFDQFNRRVQGVFPTPFLISTFEPMHPEDALLYAEQRNFHRAMDAIEGVVYRVERDGEIDFLAKYVRPEKIDGEYLPGCNGNAEDAEPLWNWNPIGATE